MTNGKVGSNMGQDEITYKCLCDTTAGKVLSFFDLVVDYYRGDMCLVIGCLLKAGFFDTN